MKSPLNKFFDKIYCINLDNRKDRWGEANAEFQKHGLEVERFSAVNGEDAKDKPVYHPALAKRPGLVGCNLSHGKILRKAKEENFKNVLVLEDDIIFDDNLNERFFRLISQLPEDWEMFYLSGNNIGKNKNVNNTLQYIDKNIARTTHTLATHAYAAKAHLFDKLIEGVEKLDLPLDMFYCRKIQKNHKCYIARPHLGWQRAGHSDIMGGFRDYKNIQK